MESQFLSPLIAQHLGRKWWKFEDWFGYYSERADATVFIPPGFVTDFASVPRLPVMYWLFGATANAPAGVHDMFYRWGFLGRVEADLVFNEAMKVDGKWFTSRWPMTAGVLVGGWVAYCNTPGTLNPLVCKNCQWGYGVTCYDCTNYFQGWRKCYREGFWPDPPEV